MNSIRASLTIAFILLLCLPLTGCAHETTAEHRANEYAAKELATAPPHGNLPDYSLPPEKLASAQHLSAAFITLHFTAIAWSILQLIALLAFGIIARMRDAATKLARSIWLQGYIFIALFFGARLLLNLPLSVYGHSLVLRYGLSVQHWPSWLADIAKGFTINVLLGGLLAVLLMLLVRRTQRWWWLWASAAAVPIALLGLCLTPVVIDPLFNQFEPLQTAAPQLSADLSRFGVPPSRQFLMRASAKVTTPNAYVTGFGPSKRVVVWDTSLGKNNAVTPGVLWMVGHECGHYVLGHVLLGTLMALAAVPLTLFLCFCFVRWAIRRFGSHWRIPAQAIPRVAHPFAHQLSNPALPPMRKGGVSRASATAPADLISSQSLAARPYQPVTQADWGMLAILWLAYALLSLPAEPISNFVSRHIEHNADIYGQEAIHGLVTNSQIAVRDEMDEDGLRSLDDPNPAPGIEFWTYTHPSTGRRAAFTRAYDPWAPGMEPKYFGK